MSEENKALVRAYMSAVDTADVEILDTYVDPAYQDHNPPPFQQGTGMAGIRQAFNYALGAFSEFHHEISAQYAEGDVVISRITG